MNNRNDVHEFILKIERNFDVNSWVIYDVRVWPIIRIKLFMAIISKLENFDSHSLLPKMNNEKLILIFLKSILYLPRLLLFFTSLKAKKFLFFGYDNHRIIFNDSNYNRFFDTIINSVNLKNESYTFDFGSRKYENVCNSEIFNKLDKLLHTFFQLYKLKLKICPISKKINMDGYAGFIKFLKSNSLTSQITCLVEENILKITIKDLLINSKFFEKILLKTRPYKVFMLNYYSEKFFALNHACYTIGIDSIDMQHGPQAETHLAYANWSQVPNQGYKLLPKFFWSWDFFSFNSTNNWTINNSHHKSIQYGNPWVDYFVINSKEYFDYHNQDFVLYSMQPLGYNKLFPQNIIDLISKSTKKWFLRLHPLQIKNKESLVEFFKEKKLINKIVIDKATNDPLPVLLSNCSIHLSNYSGCIIEASLLNKFSIILHEIGRDNFSYLTDLNKASYVNINELTIQKINTLSKIHLSNNYKLKTKNYHDYFKLINY